ncbi:MAG: hypothetical protein J5746_00460 [Victivallales bacterium]|nr:hypothetical protein [Victivallales bacterium]
MNKARIIADGGIAILLLIVALALGNAACMNTRTLKVDYGTSQLYSVAEIDQAIAALKEDFNKMAGCRLYSLTFAGDKRCQKELEHANKKRKANELYTDCIVLNSVFRAPVAGGGAWEPNELYHWSWIIVKTGNGPWIVINKGYA